MRLRWLALLLSLAVVGTASHRLRAEESSTGTLSIAPASVVLRGPTTQQRIVVSRTVQGRTSDVTGQATFRPDRTGIVQVDDQGLVVPLADGTATIIADAGGRQARVPVRVEDFQKDLPITFERDIEPLLTRLGCNAGACHGKARGQNGFQLSLLGFDPDFDFDSLTREARGRRVFPAAPGQSLLLQKPMAEMPHGGGRKIEPGSRAHAMIRQWIAAGMPRTPPGTPRVERITITPTEEVMANGARQQTIVTACYSDGSTQDVTHLAAFQSNESAVVSVTADGLIEAGSLPGEAAITARFRGLFATCEVTIPLPGEVTADLYASQPRSSFIDGLVWAKLQKLGITPSEPAREETLLRRAYIDVIGRLPTPEETRAFLASTDEDKLDRLVDSLLERPEYADHWANKWMDLLRPNPYRVGIKATLSLDAWIRDSFRRDVPYDQFVCELVTAQGSTFRDGAVTVFRDRRQPEEAATLVSQLFLGIRLECARCHHHPFEAWGQDDFYGFAAYFARIGHKGTGISPPISGSEEMFFTARSGAVKHPLTGQVMAPKPLFGTAPAPEDSDADPREALARWMTSPENPYFAEVMANRVWADLMGRGLVEPVDDLRATNPPSNGPLLKALAQDFREHGYRLKHLIRSIMTSSVYRLSSEPNARNMADTRNYARHYRQRLRAEVLLDAVTDVTQVPEKFQAAPPGSRANAMWTHRVPSLFLDTFGRPDPNQDPPCERTSDTSVVQALHLMNARDLHAKITSDSGRAAALAASDRSPAAIIEELYLLTYCRLPTDDEQRTCEAVFAEPGVSRRQATEDVLWALLNSPEFLFKD